MLIKGEGKKKSLKRETKCFFFCFLYVMYSIITPSFCVYWYSELKFTMRIKKNTFHLKIENLTNIKRKIMKSIFFSFQTELYLWSMKAFHFCTKEFFFFSFLNKTSIGLCAYIHVWKSFTLSHRSKSVCDVHEKING